MTEYTRRRVLQLSCENKCEGLLPDCRVGVKESESEDNQVECIGSTHGNLLSDSEPWYESDNRMTRQAASDSRTAGCTLASGTRLA